ncbi:unnamed protein product [Rhizophagus irregularis]|nr:unnamed protein product [Rhizophagus irregularis]
MSKTEYQISLAEDAFKDSTELRKSVKKIWRLGLLMDRVAPLVSYKLFRSLWTRGISFLINETQFFFSKTNILETGSEL